MKVAFRPRNKPRPSASVPARFLDAKLRGRRSSLYERTGLRDLAAERAVADLAHRLYPREELRDDAALERRLMAACVADLAGFLRYVNGDRRAFYVALLERYPVENLKVVLRLWGRGEENRDPADYLIDLPPSLARPVEGLSESASVEAFLDAVPLTSVRECAQAALPAFRESGRKACLEMAFDRGYWLGVRRAAERLDRSDRVHCLAPVHAELEAMRALVALRASLVYKMPWEQLESLLPPAMLGGAGDRALRELHEHPDPERVLQVVPWLGDTDWAPDQDDGTRRLEDVMWRRIVRRAERQYRALAGAFATLIAYYYLKRNEFRRLVSLTQMLRYGTPSEEMAARLGLSAAGPGIG
jgi:vacuolar-type H+-ATPase subunit C/Vma6